MTVVTRFAPSPTGDLHIGSARTALFNWLYARHCGGTFLLRVEDTDRARSTEEATQAIFDGLDWLGLDYDGEAVHQFQNTARHVAVAQEMLAAGSAYKCFATQEEIAAFREAARADGKSTIFQSPWRDVPSEAHPDAPFAVRLKAPRDGKLTIQDAVQGEVSWQHADLDDLILLRSDGVATYMLAVVVDDHDMGVTHAIRGDDHLTNAARQALIFDALGWDRPVFAHIPLIHGPDGKKMSKRHGATGVSEYKMQGYPPYAMRNYLARLGWAHGDEEFFDDAQAIEWFDLPGIGKAPARFDFKKLDNLSGQHIRARSDEDILAETLDYFALHKIDAPKGDMADRFAKSIAAVKQRAKTLQDMAELSYFARFSSPLEYDEKSQAALTPEAQALLSELTSRLRNDSWTSEALEATLKTFAEDKDVKFGAIAQPLRAALTGRASSPGIYDVLQILGQDESLARVADGIAQAAAKA